MNLKIVFASTTALGLLIGGAALAGSGNETNVQQTGDFNSALVQQHTGSSNTAGNAATAMRQDGNANRLTISQSNDSNSVGLGTNSVNATVGVRQSSGSGAASTTLQNNLTITQTAGSAGGNVVGAVSQQSGTSYGSGTARNNTTITQGGDGNNRVNSVLQRQSSSQRNVATVTQTGSGNVIDVIRQAVRSGGGDNPNEVTANMSGTNNGVVSNALSGFAQQSGASTSTIIQGRYNPLGLDPTSPGDFGNKINLIVSGSNNQFGLTQLGRLNQVGTINIGGSSNQVGTYQNGASNLISLAAVGGTSNNIGIRQVGDLNDSNVGVTGDYNGLMVDQLGNDNFAEVNISGNYNGAGLTFSGAAGGVAGLGRPSGLVAQFGNLNEVSLNITGNLNAFTLEQNGNSNEIDGTVSGNNNQVAVVQSGGNNYAFTQQTGANNNIGITQ